MPATHGSDVETYLGSCTSARGATGVFCVSAFRVSHFAKMPGACVHWPTQTRTHSPPLSFTMASVEASSAGEADRREWDERMILRAVQLARDAVAHGNHPFGGASCRAPDALRAARGGGSQLAPCCVTRGSAACGRGW